MAVEVLASTKEIVKTESLKLSTSVTSSKYG